MNVQEGGQSLDRPLYTTDYNAPFKLGVGVMPKLSAEHVLTCEEEKKSDSINKKNKEIYKLFKTVIEELMKNPEFQKDPKNFAIKWINSIDAFSYLMPESIVAAYLRRTYLGETNARDDINWFGERKYPWEKI